MVNVYGGSWYFNHSSQLDILHRLFIRNFSQFLPYEEDVANVGNHWNHNAKTRVTRNGTDGCQLMRERF